MFSFSYLFPKLSNATDVFFLSIIVWLVVCRCIHFQVQGVHDILHVIEGAELDEVTVRVTQKDLKWHPKNAGGNTTSRILLQKILGWAVDCVRNVDAKS